MLDSSRLDPAQLADEHALHFVPYSIAALEIRARRKFEKAIRASETDCPARALSPRREGL